MFAILALLFVLLATATFTQAAGGRTNEAPFVARPICEFVRLSASDSERQERSRAYSEDDDSSPERTSEQDLPIVPANLSAADRSRLLSGRRLFESYLVDWRFFEDLAPQQRDMIHRAVSRCGVKTPQRSLGESVFVRFNASQRATFVGVSHALLSTPLSDRRDGAALGDAFQLVDEVLDIQGENAALPSDQQFQLIVRLVPDASRTLERAVDFEKGENHVFHKGYPKSFRQVRKIGIHGQEAGLHFCLTSDGRFAQIHIDYRFGLLHLEATNSDVRANGNHQRHVDRWPNFRFALKRVRVLREVLP